MMDGFSSVPRSVEIGLLDLRDFWYSRIESTADAPVRLQRLVVRAVVLEGERLPAFASSPPPSVSFLGVRQAPSAVRRACFWGTLLG